MINSSVMQVFALAFAIALVIGILGWTGAMKIGGWSRAPAQEAHATPSRISDYERSGRADPLGSK